MCTHVSLAAWPWALQAAAGHRVANVDVEDNKEHDENDRCLHLHGMVRAQAERVLLVESTAIRGKSCGKPELAHMFLAKWRFAAYKSRCRSDGCTGFE